MEGIAKANEDLLYKEFGINAELLIDHAWGRETCLMKDIKNYKKKYPTRLIGLFLSIILSNKTSVKLLIIEYKLVVAFIRIVPFA